MKEWILGCDGWNTLVDSLSADYFILAWAFAFINVNSDQIAERMQRSGNI